jgi:hypothetical protein
MLQINSLSSKTGFSAISLKSSYNAADKSFSFEMPVVSRTDMQGPCNVSLSLSVNGVRRNYALGTFQPRPTIRGFADIGPAFLMAFDQTFLILSIAICGVLGWGNLPVSNFFTQAVSFALVVMLIVPETGVPLTLNGYDIRNFYQLADPYFGISVNQVAFVIVYTMLFALVVLHFANLAISLPFMPLRQLSKRFFFHHEREAVQLPYVKNLLKNFRWAYKSAPAIPPPRQTSAINLVKEAKMMIAGIRNNQDAFFFPLRLQVALVISTISVIPAAIFLLQATDSMRSQIFRTVMPFVQTIFSFVGLSETDSWLTKQQPLSQNSTIIHRAYSIYLTIYSLADELVFAAQTSAYIGISLGLVRFALGQLSLLLVARSNLLAARKGAFKIDAAISDYRAFSFIGNQIACSLLGFLIVVVLFTAVSFCLIYSTVRELILAKILAALPVIIFASIQAVIA